MTGLPRPVRLLGVNGSTRDRSHTVHLVTTVLQVAEGLGAETRLLDLRTCPLPMYEDHARYAADPARVQVKALVDWADAFVVGSPEYHGSMTGATKNWFDHFYHEFAGKCFGLVGATGGGPGVSCFTHMRAAVQYCHGWTLPYNVGVEAKFFSPDGPPTEARFLERLERMGHDLVRYGPLLKAQFDADLPTEGVAAGFASWHRRALLGE